MLDGDAVVCVLKPDDAVIGVWNPEDEAVVLVWEDVLWKGEELLVLEGTVWLLELRVLSEDCVWGGAVLEAD